MENQSLTPTPALTSAPGKEAEWTSLKVYGLGAICLFLGIVFGALFHGPSHALITAPGTASEQTAGQMPGGIPPAMPPQTPDPVFEKVKGDPNNFDLLSQAGVAAMKAGNPKSAVEYYKRALKVKDDTEVRINLGNAYFRGGEGDKALDEFATVLKADPKNDKALYNIGVVQLMAKNDPKGAIGSWEAFLKYHPDHPHKAQVQEMIKRVKATAAKSKP